MKLYRLTALITVFVLAFSLLAACGDGKSTDSDTGDTSTVSTDNSSSEVSGTASEPSSSTDGTQSADNVSSTPAQSNVAASSSVASSAIASSATASTAAPTTAPNTVEPFEKLRTVGGKGVIYKISREIYKLEVPFNSIYTSVFFVRLPSDNEWLVIDTGTTASDVETYVVPAAQSLNIDLANIKGILLTHTHDDHAGGLSTLAPKCGNATVYGVSGSNSKTAGRPYKQVSNGTVIEGIIEVVTINGHAYDACGYLDTRSKSIIAGDSLQLYGIASWGCQLYDVNYYTQSLEKLTEMVKNGKIENLFVAHAYIPSGAYAVGKDAVQAYIDDSNECLRNLIQFTSECYANGTQSASAISQQFSTEMKKVYTNFPGGGFDNAIKSIISTYLE